MSGIDWEEFEFRADGASHFDGHVGNCRHFYNGGCNCDHDLLVSELQRLRLEAESNEEIISRANPISVHRARIEIARLRSATQWQRRSIEEMVIRPVLED